VPQTSASGPLPGLASLARQEDPSTRRRDQRCRQPHVPIHPGTPGCQPYPCTRTKTSEPDLTPVPNHHCFNLSAWRTQCALGIFLGLCPPRVIAPGEKLVCLCQCSKAHSPPERRAVIRKHFSQAPPLQPARHPDISIAPGGYLCHLRIPAGSGSTAKVSFHCPTNSIASTRGRPSSLSQRPPSRVILWPGRFLLSATDFCDLTSPARALRCHCRQSLALLFFSFPGRLSESVNYDARRNHGILGSTETGSTTPARTGR
jgi:hypothetical protein